MDSKMIKLKDNIEQKLLNIISDDKNKLTIEQYSDIIQDILEDRRAGWQSELIPILKKMNGNVEVLLDLQAEYLSYRQMIIEEAGFVNSLIIKDSSKIKRKRRDKFMYYSTGTLPDGTRPTAASISTYARDQIILGLRLTKGEKDMIISGDLSETERVIESFEGYQGFLRECIKTIDHGLYGVKNKIELWKIKLNIE